MSVLSPGSPQAALEVNFEGKGTEESIKVDSRSLVSRSGSIILSNEIDEGSNAANSRASGWLSSLMKKREPPPMTTAKLTSHSSNNSESVLLAPEYPCDVTIIDLDAEEKEGRMVEEEEETPLLPRSTRIPTKKERDRGRHEVQKEKRKEGKSGVSLSEALLIVKGAVVLAWEDGIKVCQITDKALLKTLSGTGLMMNRYQGNGQLALAAYGSIIKVDLGPGEERMVKPGHLLAWSEGINITYGPAGIGGNSGNSPYLPTSSSRSAAAAAVGGKGLMVYTMKGPGTLYLRSHSPLGFRKWIGIGSLPLKGNVENRGSLPPPPLSPPPSSTTNRPMGRSNIASSATAATTTVPPSLLLQKEGLGKRIKRQIWRLIKTCLTVFVFIVGVQVAQALLLYGPDGLHDVPQHLLLILQALKRSIIKAKRAVVEILHSDVWARIGRVVKEGGNEGDSKSSKGRGRQGGGGVGRKAEESRGGGSSVFDGLDTL